MKLTDEEVVEIKYKLNEALICNKDWSAWKYKTMSAKDFVDFTDSVEFNSLVELLEILLDKKLNEQKLSFVKDLEEAYNLGIKMGTKWRDHGKEVGQEELEIIKSKLNS